MANQIRIEELENYAEIIEEDYIVDLVRILNEEYDTKRNNRTD